MRLSEDRFQRSEVVVFPKIKLYAHGFGELRYGLFFDTRDIAPRDSHQLGDLALCEGDASAEAVAECDDLFFARVEQSRDFFPQKL